ncbi:MAG: aminotransferase class V-fold PLP-dependent enzyme [Deltaproteobacteria bacterium]|nr:aminotransferase class V-fold PLP-dependent enzyme [Deltaproteobacteria bacterium]MBN2670291.1 aminotransferase class V-fold PLP-dependent enzyme [Deltaproteobacteria bacterium]
MTKPKQHVSIQNPTDPQSRTPMKPSPFHEIEKSVYSALETYANVHRGSGHASTVTTALYEKARDAVLAHLNLSKKKYKVLFCSPGRAAALTDQLHTNAFHQLSSRDLGLAVGVRAIAISKKTLKSLRPVDTGGGAARLIAPKWVVWEHAPDLFEAGTPAVINIIAFVRALQLSGKANARNAFSESESLSANAQQLFEGILPGLSGETLMAELLETRIGRSMPVPTTRGMQPYINLDNSASTPTFAPIWDVVRFTWRQPAAVQEQIVQSVRTICAQFLNAPQTDYHTLFTWNTTEAVNSAARLVATDTPSDIAPVIVSTMLEHSSNDLPWRTIPGVQMEYLSINDEGFVDPSQLQQLLVEYNDEKKHGNQRIVLVSVSGASNVLGTCNRLSEISRLAHRYNARLFVDAAQLIAHRKIDIATDQIDFLAFSAHKVYAPFGAGSLIIKKQSLGIDEKTLSTLEQHGDENAAGISALGASLSLLNRIGMKHIEQKELSLTRHALMGLSNISNVRLYGIKAPDTLALSQKVGVIPFDVKGTMPATTARRLAEERGIGVRYGCHCAHITVKRILHIGPRLEAFQRIILRLVPMLKFQGVVRVSFGLENSIDDVDALVQTMLRFTDKQVSSTDLSQKEMKQAMGSFAEERVARVFATQTK